MESTPINSFGEPLTERQIERRAITAWLRAEAKALRRSADTCAKDLTGAVRNQKYRTQAAWYSKAADAIAKCEHLSQLRSNHELHD